MSVRRQGAGRVVGAMLLVGALSSGVPLACSGFPFPPGYVAGPVLGVPATCEGDAYMAVPSGDCPMSACPGPVAFAVCGGSSFTGCTCQQPPGVPIPVLDAVGDISVSSSSGIVSSSGGSSGGPECGSGSSGGGECPPTGIADGPLFDVGDKGDCTGQVALPVKASECGTCARDGTTAYLLCDGLLYSTCSCELPPGYELVDAATPSPGKDAGGDG